MEGFLQRRRFNKILPYIIGDSLLDFGSNENELKKYITQEYTGVNLDYGEMVGKRYDTIVSLAVIEHIPYEQVFNVMQLLNLHLKPKGRIIITTPCKIAHPILVAMGKLKITDLDNIREHKHYWNSDELYNLAKESKLKIILYKKFQLGMNQIIVLEKEK